MSVANLPLVHGRTKQIVSPSVVEVSLDLGFGVFLAKEVSISGFTLDRTVQRGTDEWLQAKRAAIVLMGSKRLIVAPDAPDREKWGKRPTLIARVFLNERIHGRPVGYTEAGLVRNPELELGPFMAWLQVRGWKLSDVKAALNGAPRDG